MRPPVRQFVLTWVAGSLTMGSVAALFLALSSSPPPVPLIQPAEPLQNGSLGLPGSPVAGIRTVRPLAGLPAPALAAVFLLGFVLFVALVAIAWATPQATWLPDNTRGWIWWAVLTAALGLGGWLFAASVTFAANFGPAWQMALGYAGGGLPFALVSALLQRSWVVNLAAAGISAGLVALGFVLVVLHPGHAPNALSVFFSYLRYLLDSPPPAYP